MNKPIGIIDSGIGGLTVLKQIKEDLPLEDYIYVADSKNAPYGPQSPEHVKTYVFRIVDFLISHDVKLIVVACNTATAAAINDVRQKYSIPVVGLEPAVKPAALHTKTKNIGVLATEGTFRGNHFQTTASKYKDYVDIHLQVARGLVELAEDGIFEGEQVDKLLIKYISPLLLKNIDFLVLGCTHYPYFYDSIKKITGNNVEVIDSAKPVSIRVKDLLMINHMLRTENNNPQLKFFTTGNDFSFQKALTKLFKVEYNCYYVEKIII